MTLTARAVQFLGSQEALVQEAYKDSGGIWTWALGVTNSSGHTVFPRYKDNPQPIPDCLKVSIWLMKTGYLPTVERELAQKLKRPPTENELAAGLSFHWNTGKIDRLCANGFNFHLWDQGGLLRERREEESVLFHHGQWPNDLRIAIYPVLKPSYQPDWRHGTKKDLSKEVQEALKTA